MKKSFFLIISLAILSTFQTGNAQMGPGGFGMGPGGMPNMSDEDIEAFINVIENLPPDVKDELTKVGEDIIQRAEKLGKDPFELINQAAQEGKDVFEYTDSLIDQKGEESKPAEPTPAPETPELKPFDKPEVSEAQVEQVEDLIEEVIDALNSLRIKSISDKAKADALIPFKFYIDDLIYYLETIKDEELLKHLHAKEFETLLNNLHAFHKELVSKESQLVIEEFKLEGTDPYETLGLPKTASAQQVVNAYQRKTATLNPNTKKNELQAQGKSKDFINEVLDTLRNEFEEVSDAYQMIAHKEQTEFLFNSVLRSIKDAHESKNLIDDIQKLLKRYEPEALKLKKAQEELEKKAREEQKKSLESQFIFPAHEPRMPERKAYEPPRPDYGSPFDYQPSESFSGAKAPDVSLPTPPKKDGKKKPDDKKKKKDEDKKKKDAAKDGDKKKTDEAKRGKKQLPKLEEKDEKKVHDQMTLLKNSLKGLEKMIEKDDYTAGKLFDKFQPLLGTAIPQDKKAQAEYAKTYPDELKKRLELLKAIGGKLKEISDFEKGALEKEFENNPDAQYVYRATVQEAFDAFEKTDAYKKYLEQLLSPKRLPVEGPAQVRLTADSVGPINPDALFVFYGKIKDGHTPDKALMELNPEVTKDDKKVHTNFIKELQELYQKVRSTDVVAQQARGRRRR